MAEGHKFVIQMLSLNFGSPTQTTTDDFKNTSNQSRTNGPINAHLTIAQVMPRYNRNNEKQEALL